MDFSSVWEAVRAGYEDWLKNEGVVGRVPGRRARPGAEGIKQQRSKAAGRRPAALLHRTKYYSTVTLLARFRGLSMSQPRMRAT